MSELRSRPLPETLELAIRAGAAAGVTRVANVTAFAVPGIPVFQAARPAARSLSVSQGKGLSATAAMVSALLEAVELGERGRKIVLLHHERLQQARVIGHEVMDLHGRETVPRKLPFKGRVRPHAA